MVCHESREGILKKNKVALVTLPGMVGSVDLVVVFEWFVCETLVDTLSPVVVVHDCCSKGSAS